MNDYLPSILFIFGDIIPITHPQYIPSNLIIPAYTNAPFLLILSERDVFTIYLLMRLSCFIEPFIEHHGLLRGLVEACIRKNDPDGYRKITDGVLFFSRGWMVIHNNETKKKVTNELSTMEFSIAMLAGEGWTNKEISAHLGISVNTVKHYLTDIFSKLNVKKRDELKNYMLK